MVQEFTSVEDVIAQGLQSNVQYARKKVLTRAVKMTEDFLCYTKEGPLEGKAGDYLAIGVKGEVWPIGDEFFAESYELIACPNSCENCTCQK